MPTKNTEKEFGTISKTLHWLVLAIVIVLIAIASKSGDLPSGPEKLELVLLHASFGLLLLSVLTARLIWRWLNVVPARMPHIPTWQHVLSRAVTTGCTCCCLPRRSAGWPGLQRPVIRYRSSECSKWRFQWIKMKP